MRRRHCIFYVTFYSFLKLNLLPAAHAARLESASCLSPNSSPSLSLQVLPLFLSTPLSSHYFLRFLHSAWHSRAANILQLQPYLQHYPTHLQEKKKNGLSNTLISPPLSSLSLPSPSSPSPSWCQTPSLTEPWHLLVVPERGGAREEGGGERGEGEG